MIVANDDYWKKRAEKAEKECDEAWNKAIEMAAYVCENTDQEYEPYVGPKMLNYTCADAVRKLMK